MEIIFTESIAGPEVDYRKGQVVTMSEDEAKKFLGKVAISYDEHVQNVKEKARRIADYKKASVKAAADRRAKLKEEEEQRLKEEEEQRLKEGEESNNSTQTEGDQAPKSKTKKATTKRK